MQLAPKARMVGIRRLQQPQTPRETRSLNFQQPKINVVLLEVGGTENERGKLKECEMWIRKEPNFQLWKITKQEAFFQMYLEMMKQALPVYFISPAGMEHLEDEPLRKAYQILLEKGSGSVSEVHSSARDNVQRISFIILKDQVDKLNKLNYLHAGVALVTTETAQVVQLMEEESKKLRLKLTETSSSVNTEDVRTFSMQMENKIGEGMRVPSPSKGPGSDPESKAWKVLHDTPGVGTYNLPAP